MDLNLSTTHALAAPTLKALTKGWGSSKEVSLYLDRCQVETPEVVIQAVWKQVFSRRSAIGKVVDFGAGDGRFARWGTYSSYTGYEVDRSRWSPLPLPSHAQLLSRCAFSEYIEDADLCIGNPPYVRNQDLPYGWRQRAASILRNRTGFEISGLANGWQYFFLLSLVSAKPGGLIALVIPYEWVSRPSAIGVRDYIRKNGWNVSVYRLRDEAFSRVLTTSSITIVDKAHDNSRWEYFQEASEGLYEKLPSVTLGQVGLLAYSSRRGKKSAVSAKRGLSPGTQKLLTFSDRERARLGLRTGTDVVPCVTTLKHLPYGVQNLGEREFDKYYLRMGKKCWLLNTSRPTSQRLRDYVEHVPSTEYATSTCLSRDEWWKFRMPEVPDVLVSSGFVGDHTKAVVNSIRARAVGSVCGIYEISQRRRADIVDAIRNTKLSDRIVPHSNGLQKIEINQLNTLLQGIVSTWMRR
jgi:hypothetical protein